MAIRSKHPTSPVDRAMADIQRQIQAVESQIRQMDSTAANLNNPPAATPPVERFTQFVKEILTPPAKKAGPPPPHPRRDLFDVSAEPLKDLAAEPIVFTAKTEPDLFTAAGKPAEATMVPPPRNHATPDRKLAQYLNVGTFRGQKPLKHVQREIRNRFFMWIGLAAVVIWLIIAVVR